MDTKKSALLPILFFGALWGILEASLGHLLHYLPIGLSGMLMFPLAFYLMTQLWSVNLRRTDLLWMGLLAASIKLVDLFIPGLPAVKTLNPAMALLLQAMMVSVLIPAMEKEKKFFYAAVPAAALSWRILFILWAFFMDSLTGGKVQLVHSMDKMLRFVLLDGAINALILFFFLSFSKDVLKNRLQKLSLRPLGAFAGLAVALGLQVLV